MEDHSQNTVSSDPPPAYKAGGTPSTTGDSHHPAVPETTEPVPPADASTNTSSQVLEFSHANCANCDVVLFGNVVATDNYEDLMYHLYSRVYDLLDLLHPGEGPVVDEIRASVMWTGREATAGPDGGELIVLEAMEPKDRTTLLGLLSQGLEGYRLEVEFETGQGAVPVCVLAQPRDAAAGDVPVQEGESGDDLCDLYD